MGDELFERNEFTHAMLTNLITEIRAVEAQTRAFDKLIPDYFRRLDTQSTPQKLMSFLPIFGRDVL